MVSHLHSICNLLKRHVVATFPPGDRVAQAPRAIPSVQGESIRQDVERPLVEMDAHFPAVVSGFWFRREHLVRGRLRGDTHGPTTARPRRRRILKR